MSRKVTVYSTTGQNRTEIESSASNWSGLQADLGSNDISYSGMKAVIGESQLTLESTQAALPEGDFTLFLLPQKVKSGNEDFVSLDDFEEGYNNMSDLSPKDRVIFNLNRVIEYANEAKRHLETTSIGDPEIEPLVAKANEIQNNLQGLFD